MKTRSVTGRELGILEFEFIAEVDFASCLEKLHPTEIKPSDNYALARSPRKLLFDITESTNLSFRLSLKSYGDILHSIEGKMEKFQDYTLVYGEFIPFWLMWIIISFGLFLIGAFTLIMLAVGEVTQLLIPFFLLILSTYSILYYIDINKKGLTDSLRIYLENLR